MVAMLVSTVVLLFGVRALFDELTDERLSQSKAEIEAYVQFNDSLPVFFQSASAKFIVQRVAVLAADSFSDTMMFNEFEQEEEPYRRLSFVLPLHNQLYKVDLLQSAVETEDIAEMVFLLQIGLMLAMFFILYWVQKRLSERLWRPFYDTLESLRNFRVSQPAPLSLSDTLIDEFAELNATLERITDKIRQDYHSLKRFTENASHEIQTPLAVIQAKLETLLQSDDLSNEQLALLYSSQRAAARLSRLQQNLLLLVKIENEQFQLLKKVDIKGLVESKLALLEDFIAAKNLHVQIEGNTPKRQLDPFLAETLVGNLLGNAVKHNLPDGGWLKVQLQEKQLIVSNSATMPASPAGELIARFRRSDTQVEGLGLGLSIAKEICEQYRWTLEVSFDKGTWETIVHFP